MNLGIEIVAAANGYAINVIERATGENQLFIAVTSEDAKSILTNIVGQLFENKSDQEEIPDRATRAERRRRSR